MAADGADGAGERARAQALIDLGRYADALQILVPLLSRGCTDPDPWCLAAICDLRLGNPERALQAASYAVSLNPRLDWAHRLRAASLVKLGRGRAAVEAAAEAVRLEPLSSVVHVAAAEAYLAVNRSTQALESAQEALRLDPESADAHFVIGQVSDRLGRDDESITAYREVLRLQPHHAAARNNIGVVKLRQGRTVEATGHFVGSVRSDPRAQYAARNVTLASSAFLSKIWQVTLGGFTLDIVLWWLAFTPLSHRSWFGSLRLVVGLGVVAVVSMVAWRGAKTLPRPVLAALPREPKTWTWLVLIALGLAGSLVMTFARPVASPDAVAASRILLLVLFLAYSVDTRVVRRRRRRR